MFENNITRKIQLDKNLNTSEATILLKESLKNIGFINVKDSGHKISFAGNQKDSLLDSFQRRFKKGEFLFTQEKNSITLSHKLSIKNLYKSALIWDIIFLLIVNVLISFKGGENKYLYFILFNIGFLISNLIGYIVSSLLQKDKQIKLFELIEKKISEI